MQGWENLSLPPVWFCKIPTIGPVGRQVTLVKHLEKLHLEHSKALHCHPRPSRQFQWRTTLSSGRTLRRHSPYGAQASPSGPRRDEYLFWALNSWVSVESIWHAYSTMTVIVRIQLYLHRMMESTRAC